MFIGFHRLNEPLYFLKLQKIKDIFIILSVFLIINCSKPEASSSVDVAVSTPIQNQQQSPLCWAYAINELCEEIYKIETGNTIDLSPEFLFYYNIVESLTPEFEYAKSKSFTQSQMQSTYTLAKLKDPLTGSDFSNEFAIISDYGLMPKSAWSYPITTDNAVNATLSPIIQNFINFYLNTNSQTAQKDAISAHVVAAGFGGNVPPITGFTFQGQTYTSTNFANNVIGCKGSNFNIEYVDACSGDITAAFSKIKKVTDQGLYVPLGMNWDGHQTFPIGASYNDSVKGVITNPFPGLLLTGVSNINTYDPTQGHEVVITDVKTDPNLGPYLIAQNSWGTGVNPNTGINIGNGMVYVTQSYLQNESCLEKKWGASQNPPPTHLYSFEIVLPTDAYMASLAPMLGTGTSSNNVTSTPNINVTSTSTPNVSVAPSQNSPVPVPSANGQNNSPGSQQPSSATQPLANAVTTGNITTIPGATLQVVLGNPSDYYHTINIYVPTGTIPAGGYVSVQASWPNDPPNQYYPVCPDFDPSGNGSSFSVDSTGKGSCQYTFQNSGLTRNFLIIVTDQNNNTVAQQAFSQFVPAYGP